MDPRRACSRQFAAAAIAKTPPMATGFTAWKVAKGLYIVPLLFAYTPFIGGDWAEVLSIFAFACVGIYALVGFMEGYLESRLNIALRLLCGVLGVVLLWPHGMLVVNLAAATLFIALFIYNRKQVKPA